MQYTISQNDMQQLSPFTFDMHDYLIQEDYNMTTDGCFLSCHLTSMAYNDFDH